MTTKIISIVNQKGGVGKTTSVINLSAVLAATGSKVLIVDFDPQGNSSTGLGLEQFERKNNIYEAIVNDAPIKSTIYTTKIPNLDIIPANVDLAAGEIDMVNMNNREYLLRDKLKELTDEYRFVIIDCPPSLGLLTINALSASHSMIIPLQCEFFALEGLSHLLNTAELIKDNFNEELKIDGVVLTMYDKRNKLTEAVEKDVRSCLGDMIYKNVIPRNIRLSEASSHGIPVILYDSKCVGAVAYMKVAEEIINRNK